MSLRWTLLLTLATMGCTAPDGTLPHGDTGVTHDPIDDPSDAFAEHAGHDHLEPPPPGEDVRNEDEWTDAPAEEADEPLLSRQLLVQVAPETDLGKLAVRHGTKAVEPPDRRGYGSVAVPVGVGAQDLLADLLADPEVLDGGRMGLVTGSVDGWAVKHQWHHEALAPVDPLYIPENLGEIVVAILDTGVAYEDFTDRDGQRYVAASTLGPTRFVAPWDFVNNDAHANDDHQHGTHLASLISSQGDVAGVAPGVSIMPVKVLDDRKRGTELNLVRGIDYAVDNGADVINLSLSFPSGYLPSPLLRRVLQDARDAGVILVGAAGNEGVRSVTWPAASPHVIAVAATDREGTLAPYSNWGGMVEILAPGGDLSADLDLDSLPDGILGETIALNDPEDTGLWMVEGTSQATALVSAAVALRLAERPNPDLVLPALQGWAIDKPARDEGLGAGLMQVRSMFSWGGAKPHPHRAVSFRPFLADSGGGQLQPGVWVRLTDEVGAPVAAETVFGSFGGSSEATWLCQTDADGTCVDLVDSVVGDPVSDALAWTVTVDGAANKFETLVRPGRAVVASDSLDVLTAAMDADEAAAGATLLFLEPDGDHPTLGQPLASVYVGFDLGSGLMTSPMGVLATPPAVAPWMSTQLVSLDVDGTGLMSSPMAAQTLVVATLLPPSSTDIAVDGSGLLSSPILGFQPHFAILGSSGPLAFDIDALVQPDMAPSVDVAEPTYAGQVVELDSGQVVGTDAGTALQAHLDSGAWQESGLGAASSIVGSGQLSVAVEGAGARGVPVQVTE